MITLQDGARMTSEDREALAELRRDLVAFDDDYALIKAIDAVSEAIYDAV